MKNMGVPLLSGLRCQRALRYVRTPIVLGPSGRQETGVEELAHSLGKEGGEDTVTSISERRRDTHLTAERSLHSQPQ